MTDQSPLSDGETGETRLSVWSDISLYVWRWMPTGNVRALVYIAHGIGEYMGRYQELAKVLSENGIIVFGHDHVGHGKSGGERVYVEDFDTYIRDVIIHVKEFKEAHPGIPCYLMGHSMGGLIAACVAEEERDMFSGIIFSSSALDISEGALIKFFARVLAFFAPHSGIKPVDTSFISTIPEEVGRYTNDPLVYHGNLKAKWGVEFMNKIPIARERIQHIKIPALIIHGALDQMVPLSASEFISNNIGTPAEDKVFECFDDNFHEVLHDKGQENAQNLIKDWIIAHLD